MLKLRRRTASTLAGVAVGGLCLWAIAAWQGLGRADMVILFAGVALFLVGIILSAVVVVSAWKLLAHAVAKLRGGR